MAAEAGIERPGDLEITLDRVGGKLVLSLGEGHTHIYEGKEEDEAACREWARDVFRDYKKRDIEELIASGNRDRLLCELRQLKLSIKHVPPMPFTSFPERYQVRYLQLTEALLKLGEEE